MIRRYRQNIKGFTIVELLAVIAIIGILAVISLPNIYKIIMMYRIRSSANDVLSKARFIRALAIELRRQVVWKINKTEQSFTIQRLGHTEYDLLKDIADVVSKGQSLNDDEYILYEEKGGEVCNTTWNTSLVPDSICKYYFGGGKDKNGIDSDIVLDPTTTCDEIKFYPSGTLQSTCTITIKNVVLDRQYQILLYNSIKHC